MFKFAGIVALLCSQFACHNSGQKTFPTFTQITESVYASATVQPDSLYEVFASVTGLVDTIYVVEGDIVQKGTPLLQLSNTAPQLNVENAQLALQLARENYEGGAAILSSLADEIQNATLALEVDSLNYYRQKRLWEQKIGSRTQYENRELAYQVAQNNLKVLKTRYARTEKELLTQLEQARNVYRTSLEANRDFTVASKIHGKVYAIAINVGEILSTFQPAATLGSADSFLITLLVDEVDIVNLRVGQKTAIALDAYPGEVFMATLTKIYPQKEERSQTFTVEAVFDKAPNVLYPGLAGEANIIVAQKDSALTIPKSFLIAGNKVRTSDGFVEVTTGLQDLERVEILTGLTADTEILEPEE